VFGFTLDRSRHPFPTELESSVRGFYEFLLLTSLDLLKKPTRLLWPSGLVDQKGCEGL
jgi:hypothetical protein